MYSEFSIFIEIFLVIALWILLSRTKEIKENQNKILRFLSRKKVSEKTDIKNKNIEFLKSKNEKINYSEKTQNNIVFENNERKIPVPKKAFIVGNDVFNIPHDNEYFDLDKIKEEEKKNKEERKEFKIKSEFNIGSKIVPAIGIFSIVLGVGFFMKYAFDNKLISESGRVILGFISGISFVALGEFFRKKYRIYSNLLVGGGFVLLYLSAKFGLIYGLYSEMVTLGIMALITVAVVLVAYKINSKFIGYLALFGGFLTPFLSWTTNPEEIVLFTYTTILLLGMAFLALKRGWLGLIFGSAIGVISIWFSTFSEHYTNNQFAVYWLFLIIFFIILSVSPMLHYFSKKTKKNIFEPAMLLMPFVSGVIFIGVSYGMFNNMEFWGENFDKTSGSFEKGSTFPIFKNLYFLIGLIPAIVYSILAKLSLKKWQDKKIDIEDKSISEEEKETINLEYKKPVYVFLALAVFAIAMIPALQFSGIWITISWLVESLVLAYISSKTKLFNFILSAVIFAIGFIRLVGIDFYQELYGHVSNTASRVAIFNPIFNERALVVLVGVVVSFSIAYLTFKNNKKIMAIIMGLAGNILALTWIWNELFDTAQVGYISDDTATVAVSFTYLIYASILMLIGVSKKYIGFRDLSIVIIAFIILKTYTADVWELDPIFRIFAFIILGVVTLFIGYYYNKNKMKVLDFIKSNDIRKVYNKKENEDKK